jgi:hypothetical protein
MPRYCFVFRDSGSFCEDAEARDLADMNAAELQIAQTLANGSGVLRRLATRHQCEKGALSTIAERTRVTSGD